jgi:hypothetical protein
MGMYDNIRCNFPLPELPDPFGREFQTQDLECLLDDYTINSEGRLILHYKEYEPVPEEERPYKDDPSPLMRIYGILRVKEGSEKDIDMNYHGMLNFYGTILTGELHALNLQTGEDELHPGPPPEWFEYDAKFTDGKLVEVNRQKH